MKQQILKVGGLMCLATFFSCSTDNENVQSTNETEINSPIAKSTTQNYIVTAHQMADNFDYQNFVFEDKSIQAFISNYDLPMKELATEQFMDDLFAGKEFVDRNGLKAFFLSKGFTSYTADVMVNFEQNIDISGIVNTPSFQNLPDLDKVMLQSVIDLQADLFAYEANSTSSYNTSNYSSVYMMSAYGGDPRRNTWMAIGAGIGSIAGGLIGGIPSGGIGYLPGAAIGSIIGGVVGYASGIVADVVSP